MIRALRIACGFAIVLALANPLLAAGSESKLSKLLRLLGDEDWAVRHEASLELGQLPPRMLRALAKRIVEENEFAHLDYRFLIAMARQRLALANEDTSAQLLKELRSEESWVYEYAARSLALVGDDVVSRLAAEWPEFSSEERGRALTVLAWRGSEALPALPLVLSSLEEHPWIAAWACGKIAPANPVVLETAASQLNARDNKDRQIWLWVLERAGTAGVPGLIHALQDTDLREEAGVRLALLGSQSVPEVLAYYDAEDSARGRGLALRVLVAAGGQDAEVTQRILAASEDPSPTVREEAMVAMVSVKMEEDVRCELLRRGLKDGSSQVREAAREVVATLGTQAACVGLDLVQAWKRAMPTQAADSLRFARALIAMKQLTPEAASALVDLMVQRPMDQAGESEAALALAAMECSPSAPATFLERFETLAEPTARIRGILLLAGIAEEALPKLQVIAAEGDRRYFPAIFRCLGNLEEWPEDMHALVEASWQDDELREHACYALGGGGESLAEFRARCVAGFDSYTVEVQVALIQAMSLAAPDTPEFLELLTRLAASEQSMEMRLLVAFALGRGSSSPASRVVSLISMIDHPQGSEESKKRKKLGDLTADLAEFSSKKDLDTNKRLRESFRLLARLEEVQAGLVGTILESLRSFSEIRPGQLDSVAELMSLKDLRTQVDAIKTLEHFGPESTHLAGEFAKNLTGDRHIFLKLQSLLALRAIEGGALPVLCDLARALNRQPAELGFYAAESLRHIGASARPVLPSLLFALVNDQYTRAEWSRPQNEEGVFEGGYVPYRENPAYREIRTEIATLVTEIGIAHHEDVSWILPVLEQVAQDHDRELAAAAQSALEKLQAEAARSDR